MEEELDELESLFSEHFGRTPLTTPYGSQVSGVGDENVNDENASDEECDGVDDDGAPTLSIDERARRFMELQIVHEDNTAADSVSEGEAPGDSLVLPADDPDVLKIRELKASGCGCKNKCDTKFEDSVLFKHILNIREMDKSDKDMYIMATFVDTSQHETKRGKKRKRLSHDFIFLGKKVCRKVFMFVFDIGKHSLQNIMAHVSQHGAVPRTHGHANRTPVNALTFEDTKAVVQYICNYADEFGMPQPAAPRGRDNTPPIYLTAETTKKELHANYVTSCATPENTRRAVKITAFNSVWNQCVPHIKIATPRDDVCAVCEKLRKAIMDAVTEDEKLETTEKMKQHIISAQKERDVYNTCIKRSMAAQDEDVTTRYTHYTFDFSQNMCLPHHARQIGPLYFATLRKIQLFGLRIDGLPKQLNFLIDENETIGKDGTATHGPNAVISMIHWTLETYGNGELNCSFHADNCPGQNKNQYMIGYFMWRVMTGRQSTIEYMMQIPGHARCLVDSGFATVKKLYRRTDCDTLQQLHEVVEKSSSTNTAVRYPAWQWRDWKAFLSPVFRPIKKMMQYQYYRITSATPGVVTVKTSNDATENTYNILRQKDFVFDRTASPNIIRPSGLSAERQQYLYKVVRRFVRPKCQDITCPAPGDHH